MKSRELIVELLNELTLKMLCEGSVPEVCRATKVRGNKGSKSTRNFQAAAQMLPSLIPSKPQMKSRTDLGSLTAMTRDLLLKHSGVKCKSCAQVLLPSGNFRDNDTSL